MLRKFHRALFAGAAAVVTLLASAPSANAGIVVDSYFQQAYTSGYFPVDSSEIDSDSTGPLGTSSSIGYADITSSETTANTIALNYSLGISDAFDTFGYVGVFQEVVFHVTEDTSFSFTLSPYAFTGYISYNYAILFNYVTPDGFETPVPGRFIGAGFSTSGTLLAGMEYVVSTTVNPEANFEINPDIQLPFAMTGSSVLTIPESRVTIPEPSAFALLSILLGSFGACGVLSRLKRSRAAT
jgi:hypothetical protein